MQEIEAKFLDIDSEKIQKKLEEIGAKKVGEYFYRRRVFDYPDWRLDKDHSWLRLRDEGEKITLSFKKRLGVDSSGVGVNDSGMEEVEIVVNDFDNTAELILKLGFIEKHYAENKRIRWEKDGIEFDIDTYPGINPYLEIESSSWGKVDEAIRFLELNPNDKKIFSGNQVYALNGIKVGELRRISFDEGLVKR
ncbi:hypothetical protein A2316_02795 [Candidatus Falkowbacteria bacterium RIFOXYB2_FULL_38_15]|uniref:CYTH domain-containing protein n=1 Tax=Candidatus Falkowbacteria bacterium RIFOXYA2_FULL_38_12 TaxID=1797993 RepID=A0A1F5S1Y6_9BACT|nr:MAG: hypothetical protein A2257_02875 [Candidatus Falkowbacteria bacterium RIFOXYA2_FULL_38_12]OGF32575.1 MAG: hypothetical protein A2316_02795 [Candidatus Falkowbacteria bacterium RIFOXYB2_FULL_38_15]OGF41959.1 MAG: hypothetical protein A2555_03835 [Candidatus Falkowbacteria bacterium RIFOXYD2_FULL_39_16]